MISDEELEQACNDWMDKEHIHHSSFAAYLAGYRASEARSAAEIEKLEARVTELEKSLEWYKKPEGERNRIQRMNRQ